MPVSISVKIAATAAIFSALTSLPVRAENYIFDNKRTEVRFAYQMGLAKQNGRFSRVTGTLQYDESAPAHSQVTATIATASLETGQPIVDGELKGVDFFNVAAQPKITFTSRAVRPTGPDEAEMTGDITVNGITKPVTLEVSLKPHDDPALKWSRGARKFVATTRIQRSAFNMTSFQSMVSDDVDIVIEAIVRKQ
jgi:polyisoprenoid-binding protein YceI